MPVDDTPENLNICMNYCGTCPSLPYPPQPFLYCARGKSKKPIEKKGCNCPKCDIWKKYRLNIKNPYFCETGNAP